MCAHVQRESAAVQGTMVTAGFVVAAMSEECGPHK